MSKLSKQKQLLRAGTIVLVLTPVWWFIAPNVISPILCNPADFMPPEHNIVILPCSNVYIPLTFWLTVANLILGGVLLYLSSRSQKNKFKKF